MVIFETVMSTGHKTQKENYACQEDLRTFFFFFFSLIDLLLFFLLLFFSLKISVAEVLLVCCICTKNL